MKFGQPRLNSPTRLPALLNMARKKSKTTQSSESSSETEFGIYNVERIVAKKTDSKVRFFYFLLFIAKFLFFQIAISSTGKSILFN